MSRFFTSLLLLSLSSSFAWGIVVHNESTDGDLSNDNTAPTQIALDFLAGSSEISGNMGSDNPVFDPDFFSITIPAGNQLDEITLQVYVPTGAEGSFFAVENGPQITDTNSASALLGGDLIGSGNLNSDVLLNLASGSYGSGFTGPLGAGTYSFWFQETGGGVDYTFSLKTSAVPEPGGLILILISAIALHRRARR